MINQTIIFKNSWKQHKSQTKKAFFIWLVDNDHLYQLYFSHNCLIMEGITKTKSLY